MGFPLKQEISVVFFPKYQLSNRDQMTKKKQIDQKD